MYFASFGSPATFYVLDALTGEIKFSQDLVGLTNVLSITIGYDDNVYFIGPENGNLYRYLPKEKKIEDLGHNTTGIKGHKEVYGFDATDNGLKW